MPDFSKAETWNETWSRSFVRERDLRMDEITRRLKDCFVIPYPSNLEQETFRGFAALVGMRPVFPDVDGSPCVPTWIGGRGIHITATHVYFTTEADLVRFRLKSSW